MMREGVGLVAPHPEVVTLSRGEVALVRESQARIDAARRYASFARGSWRRGYILNPGVCGKCCELGLTGFFNARLGTSLMPDFAVRSFGDNGRDVELCGITMQVKGSPNPHARLLVRRVFRRKLLAMNYDVLAFASFDEASRRVSLRGWIWTEQATEVGLIARSPRGEHFNLEIPPERLLPMSDLLTEVSLRRTA